MRALYPGSFDPIHNGHLDVIELAARLFEHVVVAPMRNPQKSSPMFSDDERTELTTASVAHLPNVSVKPFSGLVVDAVKDSGADIIVKGLRSSSDFEVELRMAHMNSSVADVETVLLPTRTAHSFIASVFIREITAEGGDCMHLVPPPVAEALRRRSGG